MEHVLQYGQQQQQPSGPAPKPSIFDVQAQESTKELLYSLAETSLLRWPHPSRGTAQTERLFPPSTTLFLTRIRQWIPRLRSQLTRYFDEVYLAFDVLVEASFIWNVNASLCETYYGIVRQGMVKGSRLTIIQRLLSIVELSIVPYVYRRLRKGSVQSGMRGEKSLLRKLAPYLYAGYSLSNWLVRLLYVFNEEVTSASLLALLAGIRYTVPSIGQQSEDGTDHHRDGWSVVGTLMLGLRFIQWWRENRDQLAMMAMGDGDGEEDDSIPPPPPPRGRSSPTSVSESAPRPTSLAIQAIAKGTCPLCRSRMLNNPIALPTGYVCCARCLQECPQFRDRNQCPITGIPLGDASLIRPLYIV